MLYLPMVCLSKTTTTVNTAGDNCQHILKTYVRSETRNYPKKDNSNVKVSVSIRNLICEPFWIMFSKFLVWNLWCITITHKILKFNASRSFWRFITHDVFETFVHIIMQLKRRTSTKIEGGIKQFFTKFGYTWNVDSILLLENQVIT